jgi:hypothetical protein
MSRLRTDFYNDLPVEGDDTIADKDALALEFVGNADNWSSGKLPRDDLAYRLHKRTVAGYGRLDEYHSPSDQRSCLINAGHPLYHPRNGQYSRSMPARGTVMQAALLEQPSTQSCERYDLSTLARQHLEHHPHFRGRVNDVFIEHRGRTLLLTGKLPTFYLKQLVQEAVRHVPGVQHVRNLIDVVNANGVSSVRC